MDSISARFRQGTRLILLTLIVPTASLAVVARPAHAAFQPLSCGSSSFNNSIATQIGSTRFDRNALNGSQYINNNDLSWNLYMNPNVSQVRFITSGGFSLENNFDYLQVTSQSPVFKYTGNIGAGNTHDSTAMGTTTAEKSLGLLWHADGSVVGTPALLDSAQFICQSTVQPASNTIAFGAPQQFSPKYAEGLLLGVGDVIYFSVIQPANVPFSIALQGISGSGDIDLYVSTTTATPDDSNFTFRGFTNTANEFLRIPAAASQRTLFIGVRSFAGTVGHFDLHIMNQGSTTPIRPKVCTPGFALDPNSPRTAKLISSLQNTAMRITAATRGNWVFGGFDVFQSPACSGHTFCSDCDSSCKICLMSPTEADSCTVGQSFLNGTIRVANINCPAFDTGGDVRFNAFVWAHEFGHGFFGMDDEYYANGGFCGHSLMSGPSNSNFFCTLNQHCRDGAVAPMVGEGRCGSGKENWTHFSSLWIRPNLTTEPDIEIFNNWNQSAMDAVTVVLH
jgi:hypothetical protein